MVDFSEGKVYSKEMNPEEREFFNNLFLKLKEEFNLTSTDEMIGLERVIKNYIKLQRAEAIVTQEGESIKFETSEGKERVMPHPLLNWISTWESQLRSWMKEMRFTRKEKKEVTAEIRDVAQELSIEWNKRKKQSKFEQV